jgi:hypothetical protein
MSPRYCNLNAAPANYTTELSNIMGYVAQPWSVTHLPFAPYQFLIISIRRNKCSTPMYIGLAADDAFSSLSGLPFPVFNF